MFIIDGLKLRLDDALLRPVHDPRRQPVHLVVPEPWPSRHCCWSPRLVSVHSAPPVHVAHLAHAIRQDSQIRSSILKTLYDK